MRRVLLILGVIAAIGLSSCRNDREGNSLITRNFPTASWERFDFVEHTVVLDKPVTYNLDLEAWFDDSYTFDYFSVVFTVFDKSGNPLRSRDYKFTIKDREGAWKSEAANGLYHFRFPINNELTLNEPDTYVFRIENHMPITPLIGIREISIINK